MNNNLQNPGVEIPFSRMEPISADLRNFHLEPDAMQPHPSGRTAMPLNGVRLTLQMILILTPTGWTVSLSEHFPDIPTSPPSPPPLPLRQSPMLRGVNRISRSPQQYHRSGAQANPVGSPDFNHNRQQTTLDNAYSNTFRMEQFPEHLQWFRYIRPILFLNPALNNDRIDTSTHRYSSPQIPIQSNTSRAPSSNSNGRHVWFSVPQLSNQSRHRHHRQNRR